MGTLYALGVGPGDPDLMTVKARRLLQEVPLIFATTRRAGSPSYALEVARPFLDEARQQVVVLPFPAAGEGWAGHARGIAARLQETDAAFLTEGDPLLYSSFLGLLPCLKHMPLEVCVVPGVASPLAAAAAAGLPLADDEQRLAILPAMYALDSLPHTLSTFDTVVLLKVAPVLEPVLECLEAAGYAERVLHVRRVGRPEQSVLIGSEAIRAAPPTVTSDYFSLLLVTRVA
jgi:precorrin-2/cobalt-factor-2 C20-methyltransferase